MKPVDAITIGIGFFIGGIAFGSPGLLLCAALWTLIVAFCARTPLNRQADAYDLEVDRTLVEVGEAVQFRASSTAIGGFSIGWFRHQVLVNGPDGPIDSVATISFGARLRSLHELRRVALDRRAVYDITLSTDAAADVFGMRKAAGTSGRSVTVLAYPRPLELQIKAPRPQSGIGDRMALRKTSRLGQQPAGAREYERGDSTRQIHWKLTAAKGSLMTRINEAAVEPRYWLFWDLAGSQQTSTRETHARLMESMAEQWLSTRQPVGIWVHGRLDTRCDFSQVRKTESGYFLQPKRSIESLSAIRIGLASALVTERPPETSMVELTHHVQRGDVAVFVGLTLGPQASIGLEELARRGVTIAVIAQTNPASVFPLLPSGALVAFCQNLEEARYLEFEPV